MTTLKKTKTSYRTLTSGVDASRMDLLRHASPLQVRISLAIIIIPMIWKLLSLDFSALMATCDIRIVYAYGPDALVDLMRNFRCQAYSFLEPWQMQILASALLAGFLVLPTRLLLVPALVLIWWLDTNAASFRGNMFDIDTPLAVLFLVAFTPVSLWRAASLSRSPNEAARMVALSALTFVASYYIVAGLSKLTFAWDWPLEVRLGNLYYVSYVWFMQQMPPWMDWTARHFSELYRAVPALDALTAAFILLEQLCWVFAPFSRTTRLQVGLISAASHLVIAATSGIVFFTWPFVALAVTIPFSIGKAPAGSEAKKLPVRAYVVPALAIVLAVSPIVGKVLPPFYNYFSFGWKYPEVSLSDPVYALGYRDKESGKLVSAPMLQGAFYEHRFGGLLSINVNQVLTSEMGSDTASEAERRLAIIIDSTRGPNSNQWLLGKFAAPDHLIGDYNVVDMRTVTRFELLKGQVTPSTDGGPAGALWRTCGSMQDGVLERYAQCTD